MKMHEKTGVEIEWQKEIAVVSFTATSICNAEGIATASENIYEFVEKHKPAGVVVDFESVKFFSSQVLGLLLGVRAKLEKFGGRVVISAIDPQLYRVFKITNLDRIFSFFPDRQTAVEKLRTNEKQQNVQD